MRIDYKDGTFRYSKEAEYKFNELNYENLNMLILKGILKVHRIEPNYYFLSFEKHRHKENSTYISFEINYFLHLDKESALGNPIKPHISRHISIYFDRKPYL